MSRMIVRASFGAALLCLASPALAIEPGSAACKAELQAMHQKMGESVNVLDSVKNAPVTAKCPAFSAALEISQDIRESAARCEPADKRTSALRDADDVIDAIDAQYRKTCPPRPGMVRVKMTFVTRVTRDKLSKPLAAIHTCAGDGPMSSSNERFDLGRLVGLGCPGISQPTPQQMAARNTNAKVLSGEQEAFYVTRDRDGDDPRRLIFPILAADGKETTTDLLPAGRNHVGDKLDEIASFWEPVKDGVCRVHVVWRVADAKPRLILWQEAADCSAGAKTEFKTVLDRR